MKLNYQILTLVFILLHASSVLAHHTKVTANIIYAEKINQNGDLEKLKLDLYQPRNNEKKKISDDKLILLKVVSNIIKSGMNIVNVSTPEKM